MRAVAAKYGVKNDKAPAGFGVLVKPCVCPKGVSPVQGYPYFVCLSPIVLAIVKTWYGIWSSIPYWESLYMELAA